MRRYGKILAVIGLLLVVFAGTAWGILYGTPVSETSGSPEPGSAEEILAQADTEKEEAAQILLGETGITASGTGVSASGNTAVITRGGTYLISGSMENGQIIVSAGSEDTVILTLQGIELSNETDAAIYLENAGQTLIVLEEGTVNRIQSGTETDMDAMEDSSDQAEGAAIYAGDNLSITGTGTLQVFGYINNGIHTTNHLVIDSGVYEVTARNNGIKGKDSVSITGGTFTILSGGDGIKSDDTTGEGYGVISITGGSFDIQAASDGIQAQTLLEISGGDFAITTGEGSGAGQGVSSTADAPDANWDREDTDSISMKGLKSDGTVRILGGSFSIDAEDDGIHANDTVQVTGGEIEIATGDDGIHGDHTLTVEDGNIQITRSYEGLEANQIRLSGGTISIVSSDDGINAYGGQSRWGWGGGSSDAPEDMPVLSLSGSTVTINADGDGIDSNGDLIVEAGTIYVDGPSSSWNGAIDSGSEVIVTDSGGNVLISHVAQKEFSSVVFSCAELTTGETVYLRVGDQSVEIVLESRSTSAGERSRWRW